MSIETSELQARINEQEAVDFRNQLSPSVSYLQRLSVLKDNALASTISQRNVPSVSEQVSYHRDQEYALLEQTFGSAPLNGSLYINDGLYSHAVSLEGGGIITSTARIQTPDQMLASIMMVVDAETNATEYSPFSFSALARTLRGIPVVNRTRVTEHGAATEVFFREPRGNERVDLYVFAKKLKQMAESGIGAKHGYTCDIVNGNIKLTIPTDRLLQAETYKNIKPFPASLAFSSRDGRYVRQYDLSTSILSDGDDEQVFALLGDTERDLIPAIHETAARPEETTDILSLSGELRNNIKDLLRRFIIHERNTVRMKRDSFLQMANILMNGDIDFNSVANLINEVPQVDSITSGQLLRKANPQLAEVLNFVLSRVRYFTLHEDGIRIFEEAKDQIEELYPVHTGYGMVYALERAHKQFKDLVGKQKVDYDGTNTLVNHGAHPGYNTFIDLQGLNGPLGAVPLGEALNAVNLPIDRVKELISAGELTAEDQRQLDILLAIHRAPVVAGFSSLFDMIAFTEYGNAIDINTGTENPIDFVGSVRPSFDENIFVSIDNTGKTPAEKVVTQINDPTKRRNKIGVESDHGGSGEALVLVKQLLHLLNHTRTQSSPEMIFYAGYRKHAQPGFRVRAGFQSI